MKIQNLLETVLKTEKGSIIKRSPKYGVGKQMGKFVYLHSSYENLLPNIEPFKKILVKNYPDFKYNIVKYSPEVVSFLYSPDFDSANEPLVQEFVTIKTDGSHKKGRSNTIYHHKWLFVGDDYTGFDVHEAIQRSRDWLAIPNIDFSRIGQSRAYWLAFLDANRENLPSTFYK